jgi:hypothetical protein
VIYEGNIAVFAKHNWLPKGLGLQCITDTTRIQAMGGYEFTLMQPITDSPRVQAMGRSKFILMQPITNSPRVQAMGRSELTLIQTITDSTRVQSSNLFTFCGAELHGFYLSNQTISVYFTRG